MRDENSRRGTPLGTPRSEGFLSLLDSGDNIGGVVPSHLRGDEGTTSAGRSDHGENGVSFQPVTYGDSCPLPIGTRVPDNGGTKPPLLRGGLSPVQSPAPKSAWEMACKKAEASIVADVVNAVEAVKEAKRLTAGDLAARSGLSRREVGRIRNLRVRPSLRSLLSLAHAVGLELRITVRRRRVEHAQEPRQTIGFHSSDATEGASDGR